MMTSVLMEKLGAGEASKHRRGIREREMVVSILEAKLDHLRIFLRASSQTRDRVGFNLLPAQHAHGYPNPLVVITTRAHLPD